MEVFMRNGFMILSFFILTSLCYSHMSPPVQLVGEEEALKTLMPPSFKSVAQHVRLNSAQREEIYRKTGWKPSEKTIRYYTGTDDQGAVRATVFVVSEYTLHGSIRIAAACDSDGKITGAELLEVSEEAYNWVKPLIDQNFMKQVLQSSPAVPEKAGTMTKYYADQIAKVVRQVPSLCDLVKR
jgi:hypothetical protein